MELEGKRIGGERQQVPVKLSIGEFVRRWCLHIQPDQLAKARSFGGWSNNQLTGYQESCASMMNAAEVPLPPEAMQFPPAERELSKFESDCSSDPQCPSCGEPALRLRAYRARPTWSDVLRQRSTDNPSWHRKSLELDDERFWDGCFGAGINVWHPPFPPRR